MVQKIRGGTIAPSLNDGITSLFGSPGTGVSIGPTAHRSCWLRRTTLTLASFAIAVPNASDFGGTKLLDLPQRNYVIMSVEANLTVVKGGVTNGIVAATTINMGIGTAVASNATLSGTMQNLLEVTAISTNALSVAFQKHSNSNATSKTPFIISGASAVALYLNLAAAITADDSVSVSGPIDIFYLDLGKLS